ncbi:hypothetical protein DR085_02800 [Mycoplasma flocculare]|nr:hypothetical protein [Mesomycoplasma flocculare]
MGGASFRKNSILREEEAIESFLVEIKSKNYKLVYIRYFSHNFSPTVFFFFFSGLLITMD